MKRHVSRREKRATLRRIARFWRHWRYSPNRMGFISTTGRFVPDEEMTEHPFFKPRGIKYKGKVSP